MVTNPRRPAAFADSGGRPKLLAVQVLAELLLTFGLVLLLFAVYQAFWTTARSAQAQQEALTDIESQWTQKVPPSVPVAAQPATQHDEAIAILHIPRLGEDYRQPVLEGTSTADLQRGVGHYAGTAMPGEIGNFGVAGHRVTHGQPFRNLDELLPGDDILVETRATVFTYRVQTSEVVAPHQGDVLLPTPRQPTVRPTSAVMTLTTCHPEWSDRQRLIVYARLESSRPRS